MRKVLVIGGIVILSLFVFYMFSLQTQLREQIVLINKYRKQIETLEKIRVDEARQANDQFLHQFFVYENTKERYTNVKKLMTNQGFQATHPSGTNIPEGAAVKSDISNIKTYGYPIDKTHIDYMNEFDVSVSFNGVSNSDKMLVKTSMIYVQDEGWKVDDIESIPINLR